MDFHFLSLSLCLLSILSSQILFTLVPILMIDWLIDWLIDDDGEEDEEEEEEVGSSCGCTCN